MPCKGGAVTDHIGSRTVSWLAVVDYAAPILASVGTWPMAGTLEWQQLADDDPRKLAAILDTARHWALYVENNQAALAEASRDVSAGADWSTISRNMLQRNGVYIPRKAS